MPEVSTTDDSMGNPGLYNVPPLSCPVLLCHRRNTALFYGHTCLLLPSGVIIQYNEPYVMILRA